MLRKALNRLPLRSLRLRLSVAFTLLVAGLLLIADGGLIGYAYYSASLRADSALERSLVLVQNALMNEFDEVGNPIQSAGTIQSGQLLPATEALREMEPALAQEGASALITDGAGQTWYGAEKGTVPPLARGNLTSAGWRTRTLRVSPPKRAAGDKAFTVTVGVWWPDTEAMLRGQALLLFVLTVFMVIVAGFGAFFLIGRTLRPIDRLAQQARQQAAGAAMKSGERLTLTPPSPDAEVVNLVTTLNQLLHTVSETAAMKSRFYSAASHELRGPLQVLAGRAELALSLPRSRDEYQSALVEVQEQADHLIALVQSLLLMNRLEREGTQTGAFETFALAPLCDGQIAALTPQVYARQLNVVLDASLQEMPELRAIAASHGEILVRNLLDNAVRYTPSGGTLQSAVQFPSADTAVWEVVNTSVALASADVARLTEPFYRPDPSRNTETGGSGLGLSICQALCNLNGWKLSLRQDANEFHATVVFPIFDTEAA